MILMCRLAIGVPALLFSFLLTTKTGTWAFQAGHIAPTSTRAQTKLFSLQTAQVDVNPQAPRNYQGFVEWAGYYGLIKDNFRISNPQSANWGAVTTQPAPAGTRALFVPAGLRLASQTIREQEFAAYQPTVASSLDPTTSNGNVNLQCHFYLFMKVLQEYDLGNQSPWYAWMDALPRKFNSALMYDEFEVDCLPPFVKFLARRDKYNYKLFCDLIQQMQTPTINDATKYSEEITKWAFNVVFTRARAAFGEAEIIPMSDMLNHAAKANVDVQYDNDGNVHIMLLKDVQPGEALFKCYGQPTNPSRLLATYGFFDHSPPATYCKLWPGLAVTQELRNLGFNDEQMVFYVEDGQVANEVWDVMLYSVLENIDPAQQQQFYDAHMRGDADAKAQFHQIYLAQTCDGLLQHVNEVLEELDDCEKTMDGGGMGLAHEHLPIIRRHNTFVNQVFTKVQRNMAQIRSQC